MDQRAIMAPRVERQVRSTAGDLRIGRGRMGCVVERLDLDSTKRKARRVMSEAAMVE